MGRLVAALLLVLASAFSGRAQGFPDLQLEKDPWTKSQLMEPAVLAGILRDPKADKPLIYNIGLVDDIQGAIHMGGVSEKANLERFRKAISVLPKNSRVVVYCGCCPFSRCPNIRPAFRALQAAGLKNGRLLHLPVNIKTDWISKGYPLAK
ncbi:MAG TPA: rhodanese-like domain-containing protein [Sphingobacteriaceae bacterium]